MRAQVEYRMYYRITQVFGLVINIDVLSEPVVKKKKAKVVYSYEPENDDELKLEVGDVLDVIKQVKFIIYN